MAQENRRLLKRMEREKGVVRLLSRKLAPFYPHDILLNVFRLGQHCFGLVTCAAEIRSFCEENNLMFHSVKQGYAKCSTVLVNEQACITADVSIAAAVKQCGLDVLQIRPGFVELPGYPYGFPGRRQRKTFFGCVGLCRQPGHTPRRKRDSRLSSQPSCFRTLPAGRTLVGFGREFFRSGKRHKRKRGLARGSLF